MTKQQRALIDAYNKGYRIKNGKVFNSDGKQLSPSLTSKSRIPQYYKFNIKRNGKDFTTKVHQLVALQKYGNKLFEKGIIVRHKDGNSFNNFDNNILIGTHSENMMDIPKSVRIKNAINASSKIRKFTDKQVKSIRLDRKNGLSYKQLCEKYSTSKSTLSYLFNNTIY